MKTKDPLVQNVLNRMAERSEAGIKKFGVTMEAADLILYLDKLKQELRKKNTLWNLKNLKKE